MREILTLSSRILGKDQSLWRWLLRGKAGTDAPLQ